MKNNGFFSKPWVLEVITLLGLLVVYLILGIWVDSESRKLPWILDTLIFCLGIIFWLAFFSQFVLPIRKRTERIEIAKRLFHYISGSHGPAIFIENGNVRESIDASTHRGPGVIWLDTASAAVLRTATSFVGAKGPGLVFTKPNEYIAATVDLHTLRQTIGPTDDDQPFKMVKENPEFEMVQNRRWETSGMTRDGIEVIPSFTLHFKVDARENEGGTPFGYDQDSVFRAVRDSQVAGTSPDYPAWNPIIAKMAVDVWRDYLRKFKLNELFEIPEGSDQTTLQMILNCTKDHLTKEKTTELNEFGQPTGKIVVCSEYQQIKQMGWKVINIDIKRIFFSEGVEEQLIDQWTATWLKNARKEQDQVNRNRKLNETIGKDEALKEYANYASHELAEEDLESKIHAIELLVHSLYRGVIRNAAVTRRMSTETGDLSRIAHWFHEKRDISNELT